MLVIEHDLLRNVKLLKLIPFNFTKGNNNWKTTPSNSLKMIQRCSSLFWILFILLICCFTSCSSSHSNEDSTQKINTKGVYARGEMPLQHGMQLFNQHCASCHSFTENGIGPNLAGITSQVEKEWIIAFINNNQDAKCLVSL